MGPTLNGLNRLTPAAILSICGLLGACASTPHLMGGPRLTAADFAPRPGDELQPAPAPKVGEAGATPSAAPPPATQPKPVTGPVAASEGIIDAVAKPGPPDTVPSGDKPAPAGEPVLVDVKIGDVNGKPIYASKFFETMADRLKTKADEFKEKAAKNNGVVRLADRYSPRHPHQAMDLPWRQAWVLDTQDEIDDRLESMIQDELLRAEAVASLSPEQKKGLFAFVQSLSDKMESESGGSRTAANRRLAAEKGQTMDEWLRAREEETLVGVQLDTKVERRVNISWREIRHAYQMMQAEVDALPVIFHRVEIRESDKDDVEAFKKDLTDAKESFGVLAAKKYNRNNPAKAGVDEAHVKGDPATFQYYQAPDLNAAAQGLKPGQVVGPINRAGVLTWLYRNDRSRPAAFGEFAIRPGADLRSLHIILPEDRGLPSLGSDFQLLIERDLRALRVAVEKEEYIARLKAKTTMTSQEEMLKHLLEIAVERYLPEGAG